MLKKTFRLSSSKDIRVTSLRGRSFFSPYFVIKYIAAPSLRFTVIVSTKVSKRAVERNRIKRVVREAIRHSLPSHKTGDYVIIVKVRAAGKPAADIKDQLDQLLVSTRLKNRN
jgi:ribonuclease P protein component